jgi:hypothetical protein
MAYRGDGDAGGREGKQGWVPIGERMRQVTCGVGVMYLLSGDDDDEDDDDGDRRPCSSGWFVGGHLVGAPVPESPDSPPLAVIVP